MAKVTPLVLLKGHKSGIAVQLDGEAEFNLIKEALRRKVADAREFFAGANTNVTFKGRTLSEEEEKDLLDVIFSETTLDVSFVASEDFKTEPVEKQEESPNSFPNEKVPRAEYNTYYYRHSLRSGQSINFNGSVVVLGDVNAGSEIIAQGNVIILGALRGMVHAGSAGDETCFVSALSLTPTQLRIAGIITSIQQEHAGKNKTRRPEYAYVQGGQVYLVRL